MKDIGQMEDATKGIWVIPALSGTFALLVGTDLVTDYAQGATGRHLFLEGLMLVVSAVGFVVGVGQLFRAKREIHSLQGNLDRVQQEKDRWQTETRQLMAGLSVKIEQQFGLWKLSPAETEVGFLLLKGCSLKEIADARNTKLKTVQQQAQAIYQKTGLASRSELAAFFLEDLLPPHDFSPTK